MIILLFNLGLLKKIISKNPVNKNYLLIKKFFVIQNIFKLQIIDMYYVFEINKNFESVKNNTEAYCRAIIIPVICTE